VKFLGLVPMDITALIVRPPALAHWKLLIEFGTKGTKEKYLFPLLAETLEVVLPDEPTIAGSNPVKYG